MPDPLLVAGVSNADVADPVCVGRKTSNDEPDAAAVAAIGVAVSTPSIAIDSVSDTVLPICMVVSSVPSRRPILLKFVCSASLSNSAFRATTSSCAAARSVALK